MEQKIDIAIIGECLIELSANGSLADTSTLNKFFGGDTVTTAVTAARLGGKVTYLTKKRDVKDAVPYILYLKK